MDLFIECGITPEETSGYAAQSTYFWNLLFAFNKKLTGLNLITW